MTRSTHTSLMVTALLLGAFLSLGYPQEAASQAAEPAVEVDIEFDDIPALTKKFIGYNRSIQLTPDQERIKAAALSSIPAPCCSEFPLATCCCPCNLAKSVWGLTKHLITDRGYGVDQVQVAAVRWVNAVNPNGFSGTVCKTGGCGRPFSQNGCGGMNENDIKSG